MANKKKNPEVTPTSEQRSRAASSSRKRQRKTYVSKTVKIVLVVIGRAGDAALRLGHGVLRPDVADRKRQLGL